MQPEPRRFSSTLKENGKLRGHGKTSFERIDWRFCGFRLVASAREGRVNQYVEFELTAKYFITRAGDERMKFLLTLKKIFPSLDKNSRNKKGIYTFGRVKLGQQVEE